MPTFMDDNDSTATVYHTSVPLTSANNGSRVGASVTFAPLPPGKVKNAVRCKGRGIREDYSLGDIVQCPSHMVDHSTSEQAYNAINSLKAHDFAFIKKPSGPYTYGILACRTLEPPVDIINCPESLEESMVFAICGGGSKVKLKKNQWVDRIRLVSMEGMKPSRSIANRQNNHTSDNDTCDDWVPPNVVSFACTCDDNLSVVSLPSFSN